jgi:ferredoxin
VTYVIAEPCIGVKDGTCVEVCPVDCIEGDGEEYEQMFIDPERCIDCDLCVTVCPVDAIYNEGALPDEWLAFVERNRSHFQEGITT